MFTWVCVFLLYFKGLEPAGRKVEREKSRGEKKGKMGEDEKRKDDRGMDAQVLLLMDPGAELGWAVLSDTLPSAGGEREQHRVTGRTQCFGR